MNIPRNSLQTAILSLAGVLLVACGEGSRSSGITADVTAYPSAKAATTSATTVESVVFRRAEDGMKIELEMGLVNLVAVALERCESTVAARGRALLRGLQPMAVAHAHGGGDVVQASGPATVLGDVATSLGRLDVRPGRYCGLTLALQPGGPAAKHGAVLDTSMAGASVNVAPCYYPDTVGVSDEALAADAAKPKAEQQYRSHRCVQAKYRGDARLLTLALPAPQELLRPEHSPALAVGIRYEQWFDGIAMDRLAGDGADNLAEQAKLADNVVGALALEDESD